MARAQSQPTQATMPNPNNLDPNNPRFGPDGKISTPYTFPPVPLPLPLLRWFRCRLMLLPLRSPRSPRSRRLSLKFVAASTRSPAGIRTALRWQTTGAYPWPARGKEAVASLPREVRDATMYLRQYYMGSTIVYHCVFEIKAKPSRERPSL